MYASQRSGRAGFSTMQTRAIRPSVSGRFFILSRKPSMNANQINGALRTFVGRVQEQVGQVTGNRRQVLRGLQRQVLGAAEKRLGDCQASTQRNAVVHRGGLHL